MSDNIKEVGKNPLESAVNKLRENVANELNKMVLEKVKQYRDADKIVKTIKGELRDLVKQIEVEKNELSDLFKELK